MRRLTAAALLAALVLSPAALAGDGQAVIPDAGHFHPLPKAAYQPDRQAIYKVVFSLDKAAAKPDTLNPGLDRLARTVNLYAQAGVPLDHLKFVAVIAGGATPIALDDAHYRKKYGVANPNLAVITELRKAGVDMVVCGQAVAGFGFQDDWIAPQVTLALSALTTITELEQQGYALMPL